MTATRPADDAGVAVVPGAERAGGQGVPGGLSAPPVRGASEAVGSRREIIYFVLRSRKVIVAAVILVVITGFEVATSYLDGDVNSNLLIAALGIMAGVLAVLDLHPLRQHALADESRPVQLPDRKT